MAIQAFDAYLILKNGGKLVAEGETYDKEYGPKGAMQINSFSLSSQVELEDEPEPASGSDSGKESNTTFFKMKITKEIDYASPDLFIGHCEQAYKKKLVFDEAKLVVRKSAGKKPLEYLVIDMKRVVIESWKLESSDGDDLPEEEFTLTFRSLRMEYQPQTPDGRPGVKQPGGWDFGNHVSIR